MSRESVDERASGDGNLPPVDRPERVSGRGSRRVEVATARWRGLTRARAVGPAALRAESRCLPIREPRAESGRSSRHTALRIVAGRAGTTWLSTRTVDCVL